MKVDAVIVKNKKVLTIVAIASVMTLLVFSSAVVEIRSSRLDQGFGGPGYIYTLEYQCGTLITENDPQAQPGKYSTNILIHNPFTEFQEVFIKVLPVRGTPVTSEWLNKTSTITTPWIIGPNGALEVDCKDITTVAGDKEQLDAIFSKGLIVISHPVKVDATGVLIEQPLFDDESLDVTVAYTYYKKGDHDQKHFYKALSDVRTRTANGITETTHELLVAADPAAPLLNFKQKVRDMLSAKGIDLSLGFKIREVTDANYLAIAGGGIGASKDVETIKGKFIPFVPVPQEILVIT